MAFVKAVNDESRRLYLLGYKNCWFMTRHNAHEPRLLGWLIRIGAERVHIDLREGGVRAMCQLHQLRAALAQADYPIINYWSEHGEQMPGM